ncbi:MAG: sterol desaturase family protein [Nannocystaceae bacterium]|nr:sterol desaturase family protein [Nannocystaceae bacterium]
MRNIATRTFFPLCLAITGVAAFGAIELGVNAPLIPLGLTILFVLIILTGERLMPRVAQRAEPGETRADLGFLVLTALSDPLTHAGILALVTAVACWLPEGLMHGLPLWAGAVGVLVVGGLGDYWAHRLSHGWGWWWKLHAVHHAPRRMVALNNFRLHPLDLALKLSFAVVPVLVLGFSAEAIAVGGAFKGLNVAFQHADMDLRHGWLNRVFSTNSVHRWHHSAQPDQANANYGGVLSLFDIAFGTYRVPPEDSEPTRMGLFDAPRYPVHGVTRSTLAPFCWQRCVSQRGSQTTTGVTLQDP